MSYNLLAFDVICVCENCWITNDFCSVQGKGHPKNLLAGWQKWLWIHFALMRRLKILSMQNGWQVRQQGLLDEGILLIISAHRLSTRTVMYLYGSEVIYVVTVSGHHDDDYGFIHVNVFLLKHILELPTTMLSGHTLQRMTLGLDFL